MMLLTGGAASNLFGLGGLPSIEVHGVELNFNHGLAVRGGVEVRVGPGELLVGRELDRRLVVHC